MTKISNETVSGIKNDAFAKGPCGPVFVIPAKAGIQLFQKVLDSGFHRSEGLGTFYEIIKNWDLEFI